MLSQSDSEIVSTLKDMENNQKAIKLDLLKICWYMRGGVTYDEANTMSPEEREMVGKLVKENLEDTRRLFLNI